MGESARLQLKVRHYEVDQYGHVNQPTGKQAGIVVVHQNYLKK